MAPPKKGGNKAALQDAFAASQAEQAGAPPDGPDSEGPGDVDPTGTPEDDGNVDARLSLLEELLLQKGIITPQDIQQLMSGAGVQGGPPGGPPAGPPPGMPMGGPPPGAPAGPPPTGP